MKILRRYSGSLALHFYCWNRLTEFKSRTWELAFPIQLIPLAIFCILSILIQLAGAKEHTNWISAKELDTLSVWTPYDMKQSDSEAPVILELWGKTEYPFFSIASTLTWGGSTRQDPIYELNGNVWHSNCIQTNDLCWIEYFEIELFDHLTVCKQMTVV